MEPIVYDLYCGLGGWSEGFLAEDYECIGFDTEAHDYGTGGYPGELRIRDVRSIHGSELKDATCIVGSSPCQEFSYRAMPWKRAKALPPPYLGMELFNAQFRIQREACEAAGRYIPMVVENVRGAQPWVGRARANYGSFYLWGDVGMAGRKVVAGPMKLGCGVAPLQRSFNGCVGTVNGSGKPREQSSWDRPVKVASLDGGRRTDPGKGARFTSRDCGIEAVKGMGIGSVSWGEGKDRRNPNDPRNYYSKDPKRKAASAMIAKIPFPLAQYIAQSFKPHE